MPRHEREIHMAWADMPLVVGKHEAAEATFNINKRVYLYDRSEVIHIYKEKPNA